MRNGELDIIDKLDGEEGFVELVLKSGDVQYGEPLGIIYNEDEEGWDTVKRILFKPYLGLHSKDYELDDIVSYKPIKKESAIMLSNMRFLEYKIVSDEGFIIGIRDDAPEEIKEEYAQYLKQKEEAEKIGDKL